MHMGHNVHANNDKYLAWTVHIRVTMLRLKGDPESVVTWK